MSTAIISTALQPTGLVSDLLTKRPERAPNLLAEVAAFRELSQILSNSPHATLQRFLEIALRLCGADTAGLNLLEPERFGQPLFQWMAATGAMVSHGKDTSTRDFSACGLCLETGKTILVLRPANQTLHYLSETQSSIVEALIVPLYDNAKRPLGTIWIAHHDCTATFCANDARIVEQLAVQLVLALKLLDQAQDHRSALALIESHKIERQVASDNLADQRRLRVVAETSENGIRQEMQFKDAAIQEVHHRVKNTLQIASNLLSLQARASTSGEVRAALHESRRRLHLLAKVHELLYMSTESAREVLMPTLLREMGNALRESFAEMSARVNLKVISEEITLSSDDAIPIALLANEVITNAYKYAFPNNGVGEITISLHRAADDQVILRVTDNGIGMHSVAHGNAGDATANPGGDGMGLRLVRSFTKQLKGTLAFANTNRDGTEITLTIRRTIEPGVTAPRSNIDAESALEPAAHPREIIYEANYV